MAAKQAIVEPDTRIGLLGGSFNPPHTGHLELSLSALKALSLDQVWWLVSPANPQKDKSAYAAYETRLDACRELANHQAIYVSDFEETHQLTWSRETIKTLRDVYPQLKFVWLMGADNLATFHTWQDWREIMEAIPVAVFNRPGYGASALASPAAIRYWGARRVGREIRRLAEQPAPAWGFVRETANTESSTRLREKLPDWGKNGLNPRKITP